MTTTLSDFERIKANSNYLRGTIAEGLVDPVTGAISDDDNKVLKFHGSYLQDDRDLREVAIGDPTLAPIEPVAARRAALSLRESGAADPSAPAGTARLRPKC